MSGATYTVGQTFTQSGAIVTVTGSGVGVASTKALSTCDTNDIVVWAGANIQIWSACNMGATTASATLSATSSGAYYQWGRNDDVTAGTFTVWVTGHVSAGELNSSTLSTGNQLFYAGDTTYGEWYFPDVNVTANDRWVTNTQGPCPAGYGVPSDGVATSDWQVASNIIVGTTSPTNGQCNTIRNTLKLPLSGARSWGDGSYFSQGTSGFYWSSSLNGTSISYSTYFASAGSTIAYNANARAYGFAVRCVRH